MPKLYIYRGIPASGKTTAARKFVMENPGTVRINRDDLRYSMFGKYWDVDEQAVTHMQMQMMKSAMRKRWDIVSDNTNLRAAYVRPQLVLAVEWGYEVEFRDFPVSLNDAIMRDRTRGEKSVGERVIRSFFDRFLQRGTFPPIPVIPPPATFTSYVPDTTLPEAIVVDIDGTLAHMNGRGPYEDHLVHTDTVDEIVRTLVEREAEFFDTTVIILSGRDEGRSRTVTEEWLKAHRIPHDHLYMRPAGDTRKDAIVKSEIFDASIAPNYNVKYVLDDRNQVVEMWRAKGIKCLQVEPGDF